jgi:hypothetical protein
LFEAFAQEQLRGVRRCGTGRQQVNFDAFAALATDVMQYAIIDAATSARSAYGLPAAIDMKKPENDK